MFARIFHNVKKKRHVLLTVASMTSLASFYNYKRHLYERELFNRMNQVMWSVSSGETKLSGVFLQQRQAFGWMWYFQWLMPYHQSLKFVDLNTNETYRHVGLGHVDGEGRLTSAFKSHTDAKYTYLNTFETSIPIECWVDFKYRMGHFPSNVDAQLLVQLTKTPDEQSALSSGSTPTEIYKTKFGSIMTLPNGQRTISTCQSAAMQAVMKEELIRNNKTHREKF